MMSVVGDRLDLVAVGLDEALRGDIGLTQDLRRGPALAGSESTALMGSRSIALPPEARFMICARSSRSAP